MQKNRAFALSLMALVAIAGADVAQAASTTVDVAAYSLWTDTGVAVQAGQRIRIHADPASLWSWGGDLHDAAGAQPWEYPNTWDRFLFAGNHGELLGFVGADPFQSGMGPYYTWTEEGAAGNGENQLPGYLHVGEYAITPAGFETIAAASGTLFLGHNDDSASGGAGDNWGSVSATITVDLAANVVVNPDELDAGASGKAVTAYIDIPGVAPNAIVASSVRLVTPSGAVLAPSAKYAVTVSDLDADGILELVVKFDRAAVVAALCAATGCPVGTNELVTLRVAGKVSDGTDFEGAYTIRLLRG